MINLQKALKEKKKMVGEIVQLKNLIHQKNSYIKGDGVSEKFPVVDLYDTLIGKVETLINLKHVINEANRDIQSVMYQQGELKSLISFWSQLPVGEGTMSAGYGANSGMVTYVAQFDEIYKINRIGAIQGKIDALQDIIDTHNQTTMINIDIENQTNAFDEE